MGTGSCTHARFAGMAEHGDRDTRRLTIELPADLVDSIAAVAELSHRTIDQLLEDALTPVLERYDVEFPLPAPPDDLQLALDADPAAAAFFATVGRRNHHAILGHVEKASRPYTRAQRIEQTVAMLRRGETPYRR